MFDPPQAHWNIEFMEAYDVIDEFIHPVWGKYLVLAHDPLVGYAPEHFVLLPDDDEEWEEKRERIWKNIEAALNA